MILFTTDKSTIDASLQNEVKETVEEKAQQMSKLIILYCSFRNAFKKGHGSRNRICP